MEDCFELRSPAYFSVTCAAFSPVHSRDASRREVLSSATQKDENAVWVSTPVCDLESKRRGEGPSYNQRLWGPAGDRVPSWGDLYEQTGE